MRIFAQITKVDVAKREVWGRATQEVVDKSGEIFDFESSVPYFKAWSEGFAKDTDGKSLGNIRAMHGKVTAGKCISIDFNAAEKAIDIGTKIVDDNEWEKVEEGCYTGFSIGGSYVKKWSDPANKDAVRFTADPAEISIVDSPCVPTAKFFDVVKADGVLEQVAFKDPVPEPFFKTAETIGELRKGMGTVADLASMIQWLSWMCTHSVYEAEQEGDASKVPAQLRNCLASLISTFTAMSAEETAELMTYIPAPPAPTEPEVLQLAAGLGLELAKAGAKFSAATQKDLAEKHQVACDHMENLKAALGELAKCWAGPDKVENADTAEFTKLQGEATEALAKVATLEAELAKRDGTIATLQAEVDKLGNLPEPARGVLLAFLDKADEITLNGIEKTQSLDDELRKINEMPDGPEKAKALITFTHKTGGR